MNRDTDLRPAEARSPRQRSRNLNLHAIKSTLVRDWDRIVFSRLHASVVQMLAKILLASRIDRQREKMPARIRMFRPADNRHRRVMNSCKISIGYLSASSNPPRQARQRCMRKKSSVDLVPPTVQA